MKMFYIVLISFYLSACTSHLLVDGPTRDRASGANLRIAPSWDSAFVRTNGVETGISLHITPPPPHEMERYPSFSDSLQRMVQDFSLLIWRYPIDTVLRKNESKLQMIGGTVSEYYYEVEDDYLLFRLSKSTFANNPTLPSRVDSVTGMCIFIIPAGRYLLYVQPGEFEPEPKWIKELEIRRGYLSQVNIQLMPQPSY